MPRCRMRWIAAIIAIATLCCWLPATAGSAPTPAKKTLSFQDLMKFRAIKTPVITEDGGWIAFSLDPDRGDGEGIVRSTGAETIFRVPRGAAPVLSKDGRWAAFSVKPTLEELEKADAQGDTKDKKEEGPKPGMALVATNKGIELTIEKVERFAFSDDNKWIAYLRHPEKESQDSKDRVSSEGEEKGKAKDKKRKAGGTLHLRNLSTGKEVLVPLVREFAFDETSHFIAYAVSGVAGNENGLFIRDLVAESTPELTVVKGEKTYSGQLTWAKEKAILVFLHASEPKAEQYKDIVMKVWDKDSKTERTLADAAKISKEWEIPVVKNKLTWSDDGARVFFGTRPSDPERAKLDDEKDKKDESSEAKKPFDPYDSETILKKRGVDVWHGDDPLIISQQKESWKDEKDRSYLAVANLSTGQILQLANIALPDVKPQKKGTFALGLDDLPYRKEMTWSGRFSDIYTVNVTDGTRRKVATHVSGRPSISPNGRYVAYFSKGAWLLISCENGQTSNLTGTIGVSFADEDDDRPTDPEAHGMAEWIAGDKGLLIYDKFDVWLFSTDGGTPVCVTGGEGRKSNLTFRVQDLDKEKDEVPGDAPLLLLSYHNSKKHFGFYTAQLGQVGVRRLIEEGKKFEFVAKAKKGDFVLFTRESYEEFPDLWITNAGFIKPRKLTNANSQIFEFAWGTAELVEWTSGDGRPVQGVLIKPGNFDAGKRYPVIVYYYERSSQRMYEFNETVVNHRPTFPLYASNGYAIFLPDIWFEVGRPGLSAVKCLVPGVQKLVDMGIADLNHIGLHGHSWGGYQTAFVVTQTNIFAAAIAGAAVTNMTSAYGGIRWESGMSRQWQYEKEQSRIGATLWQDRDAYIENSAVFYANRIQTPLMLMSGDADGAVPWYQSIEMYMAMRRLGKPCVFLQYRGEGHHLKRYANKLDYSIRMKEFFDHYLKGNPAPEWLVKGIAYRGK